MWIGLIRSLFHENNNWSNEVRHLLSLCVSVATMSSNPIFPASRAELKALHPVSWANLIGFWMSDDDGTVVGMISRCSSDIYNWKSSLYWRVRYLTLFLISSVNPSRCVNSCLKFYGVLLKGPRNHMWRFESSIRWSQVQTWSPSNCRCRRRRGRLSLILYGSEQ